MSWLWNISTQWQNKHPLCTYRPCTESNRQKTRKNFIIWKTYIYIYIYIYIFKKHLFYTKEETTKNEFMKTIIDTQKGLVHTSSSIQEKASFQNLNKRLNPDAANKINIQHHKINKVSKSTFDPAIKKTMNSIARKTAAPTY